MYDMRTRGRERVILTTQTAREEGKQDLKSSQPRVPFTPQMHGDRK